MTDDEQHVSMQLILIASDVKKLAFEGIKLAKLGKISEAQGKFEAAQQRLGEGHQAQSKYISERVNSDDGPSLLMVHAQDHLSMAMTTIELGQELVAIYAQVQQLKR
ncbi:PTS lactose/cellobiose transporter subunit IIA [Lactobacillus sp. LC28-10]|uniref:PTS lactose/cellobiose transporter subunit IIA n=1 Tax=Secundilactobacillus angelensis TaxID=2722706 RepID=A0ABX1KWR6_9LACO|nr:PTS lactose/cellobiose transporter subunit IIA [Secundilactobacillus angelensis]MCH5462469.1 PTS lactose/cellobiose transporter subunit IIA [Secundilactobacillus angelensis]NLR18049.1 PTS lactose/cellobiose transporter subunit IIA [Secundilactobacillus angelensis]